jgi:hypothetical protein
MNTHETMILNKELELLKNNEVVKTFVETEAYIKIASDISAMPGRVCTEKAARLIVNNTSNPDIKRRWLQYVAIGYAAIMMAKYQQVA